MSQVIHERPRAPAEPKQSPASSDRALASRRPIRAPFARVFAFGNRHAAMLIVGALVLSTGIHASLAQVAVVTQVTLGPEKPTCKVGDTVQLEAAAHTRFGAVPKVSAGSSWASDAPMVASPVTGGLFRCLSAGTATVTASYGGKSGSILLTVETTVVMIDAPKEEPPPPEVKDEPSPATNPNVPPETKPTLEPPPPPAAKAGNLLTAPDEPGGQKSDDPVSFVTDPNGEEYGSGTVAKGGTADHGAAGAKATGSPGGTGSGTPAKGPPSPPPPPPTITAADLSRKPVPPGGDPCKGTFPSEADDDTATVQLLVTTKPGGQVEKVSVVGENPKGQGFGRAARTCVLGLKFGPALDKEGKGVTFTFPFNIRYVR
jgi:hypothetical protein